MRKQASKGVLFLTVFIDLIGFGIVLPLIPFFSRHFEVSGVMVTALSSVFSLMQFLFAPFWGGLSDRVGRRPVLLVSLLGSTLSYLALGFCHGYWEIFATRVFAGFFGANIAVANAYMADITPPEKRAQAMGLIGVAFGLGFVLGPAIGGGIATFVESPTDPERVYHVIGWVAGSLCGLNFLVASWILPESLSEDRRKDFKGFEFKPLIWGNTGEVFKRPLVVFLVILYGVISFSFSNFENLFALLMGENFRFGVKEGNYLFLYLGLIMALVQGGLVGRLVKVFGETVLMYFACVLFSMGMVVLPWVHGLGSLFTALAALGVGQGLNRSTILGLISRNSSDAVQGSAMGVAQSAGSMGRILGPLAGGFLYDFGSHSAPFLMAGGLVLAATGWGIFFSKNSLKWSTD